MLCYTISCYVLYLTLTLCFAMRQVEFVSWPHGLTDRVYLTNVCCVPRSAIAAVAAAAAGRWGSLRGKEVDAKGHSEYSCILAIAHACPHGIWGRKGGKGWYRVHDYEPKKRSTAVDTGRSSGFGVEVGTRAFSL